MYLYDFLAELGPARPADLPSGKVGGAPRAGPRAQGPCTGALLAVSVLPSSLKLRLRVPFASVLVESLQTRCKKVLQYRDILHHKFKNRN